MMGGTGGVESWVGDVLGFWFGELTYAQWFKTSDAVDAEVGRRFRDLYERLAAEQTADGVSGVATHFEPSDVLARIIVLDQFPRNMFRATPRAFATDRQALALARLGATQGLDRPGQA